MATTTHAQRLAALRRLRAETGDIRLAWQREADLVGMTLASFRGLMVAEYGAKCPRYEAPSPPADVSGELVVPEIPAPVVAKAVMWTPERDEAIRRIWGDGLPWRCRRASAATGLSPGACASRASVLGVQTNRCALTTDQIERARRRVQGGATAAQAARRENLRPSTLYPYVRDLVVAKPGSGLTIPPHRLAAVVATLQAGPRRLIDLFCPGMRDRNTARRVLAKAGCTFAYEGARKTIMVYGPALPADTTSREPRSDAAAGASWVAA